MQVQVLPREISRGARTAATLNGRSSAVEATINERVELVRRWGRAMAMGLSSQEAAVAVGVSRATLYRWRRNPGPRSKRPRRGATATVDESRGARHCGLQMPAPGLGQAEDRPSAASSGPRRQLRRLDLGRDGGAHPGPLGGLRPRPVRLVLHRRGAQAAPAPSEAGQTPQRSPQGQETGRRSADRHPPDLVSHQPHHRATHCRRPLFEMGPRHDCQPGHRRLRQALPRPPDRAGAVHGPSHPGRRRKRVHHRLQAGLQRP